MTREISDNLEFKMLLKEALELGIESARECGHIKCLTDKIQAFYYRLSEADKDQKLEAINELIIKIKDFIKSQKMIEEIEFKKFNDDILEKVKKNLLKLINEFNEPEPIILQMG